MITLVHSKETEEKGRSGVGSGAAFPLPEEGSKIVSFAHDSLFGRIEMLGKDVEVEQTPCQFQARDGN